MDSELQRAHILWYSLLFLHSIKEYGRYIRDSMTRDGVIVLGSNGRQTSSYKAG